MNLRSICLVVHNVRSAHNVGSILRTADGMGLQKVYLTGYTPYPAADDDSRLPHERRKVADQISKTALGAEDSVSWKHLDELAAAVSELKQQGYTVVALEQSAKSTPLNNYRPADKVVLIVGNEVHGLDQSSLKLAEKQLFIPMLGAKESFNVSIAAAMALYHLRYQA